MQVVNENIKFKFTTYFKKFTWEGEYFPRNFKGFQVVYTIHYKMHFFDDHTHSCEKRNRLYKQLQFSFTVVYELHKRRQSIHYISPDLKSSKDHGWILWTRQFWMQPRSNGTEHGMDATRSWRDKELYILIVSCGIWRLGEYFDPSTLKDRRWFPSRADTSRVSSE